MVSCWPQFYPVSNWGWHRKTSSLSFVPPSIHPSVHSLTTFSGFCTFADKSLGRDSIKIAMLMYPDDLPSAGSEADGYCCHFMHSSVCPTIHGIEFGYCKQIIWKKWSTFGMLMYPEDLSPYSIDTNGNYCHFIDPIIHELGFWYCGQIAWKKSLYFGMLMYPDDLPPVYWHLWVLLSVRPSMCSPHFQVSVHLLTNQLEEMVYILACWCIQMTYLQFINAYRYYCPSVHSSGHLVSGSGLGWASGWLLPSLRDICCHNW